MRSFRAGLNYSNVMATIAVFAALGTGGAYAAGQMVGSAEVIDESLTEADVQDGSLNAAIAPGAITAAKLAPNSVSGAAIADNGIGKADVGPNAIDSGRVENNSLTTVDVWDGSLIGTDIANGTLTGAKIADSTVTGADVVESTLAKVPTAATADIAGDAYVRHALGVSTLWNNDIWHKHAALDLPAGNFALTATLELGNNYELMSAGCRLRLGATVVSLNYKAFEEEAKDMTLLGIGSLSAPGQALLECHRASNAPGDHDGWVRDPHIMAVKVAHVH